MSIRKLVVLGAGAWLVGALMCQHRSRQQARVRGHAEDLRNQALRDTFPASDPPATQDFAIPVNRL